MTVPTNRQEFRDYCLGKLGHPVIKINLDLKQIDDRIDEALKYYYDYHFDGVEKAYLSHQITDTDIANRYITLPDNIIGAVKIFPIGDPLVRNDDLFNIRYQIALNDLYTLTSVSMVPYYMTMEHLSLVQQMLVGMQPIRYNRINNILYIDADWDQYRVGEYILVEAYQIVDPDTFTKAWGDRWLANYATALIEENWGNVLSKFSGVAMPGGVQFNGEAILDRALRKRQELEMRMITDYSLPPDMEVG